MKKAIITGVNGQDGSYLTELLLEKGYQVHGLIRRNSTSNLERLNHLSIGGGTSEFQLHYGDLTDQAALSRLIFKVQPDEIYNLAAQSHVKVSFETPTYTADVTALGTLKLLEIIRLYQDTFGKKIKMYQAGSSEMFGATAPPQSESTPFYPRSPYAVSKMAAYWYCINYREAYDVFVSNGILFNHESPRRGEEFVTRKITRAVGRIKVGLQNKLYLGNLDAKRDWGFAGDYVKAMWLMLQGEVPKDYVIATGESHSVREFVELAFKSAGLDWEKYVEIDQNLYRPTEVDYLLGDPSMSQRELNWIPEISFSRLVDMMVTSDMALAQQECLLQENGLLQTVKGGNLNE